MADSLGLRRDGGSPVWEVVIWGAHKAQNEVTAQDRDLGFVRHRTEETKYQTECRDEI